MATLRIEDFGGRVPRRSARLLPPNFAQTATNCKLFSGELRGWNTSTITKDLGTTGTETAFRIPDTGGDIWFTSAYDNVHIQKGTLVNDAYNRYYWTSGTDAVAQYNTSARIDAASASFILGAPPPSTAPTMVAPSGGGSTLTVTRAFVYTFVSAYGEESAPSPVLTQTGLVDDTWTLASMEVNADIPSFANRNFSTGTKRIYRTITSSSGQTNFFFVKEVSMATTSTDVSDTDEVVAYNSLLESTNWNEPPDDLEGLITHPNGFLVGFVGRDIYFSEPYRPHAWPAVYVLSCDADIMGLGVVGNTIGIATTSNPYGCTGIHPEDMSLTKSTTVEPCLSKKGVVTLPNGVYYPSNNGLAWLNPVGAKVITQPIMTKEEWQNEFSPSTLNACRYGTRYLAFEDTTNGFIFDPEEPRAAIVDIEYATSVDDIYTDVYSGIVQVLSDDKVYEWDPSANTIPIIYTWKSKSFEYTKPLNLGAGMLKFNDSVFTSDATFITALEAINTTIFSGMPPGAPLNSRAINGVQKLGDGTAPTYVADLQLYGLHQSGATNNSDLINIAYFSAQSPVAIVAVFADGLEKYRHPVTRDKMFRLPAGYKAHTYEVEIVSNTDVYSIALAETGKELMKV